VVPLHRNCKNYKRDAIIILTSIQNECKTTILISDWERDFQLNMINDQLNYNFDPNSAQFWLLLSKVSMRYATEQLNFISEDR
jgi:hypothetical protein